MAEMRDIVILLPGIMGSALERGGEPVWDLSAGAVGSFVKSLGSSLSDLAPPGDAVHDDGIRATHLLDDTHLIPYLWKIDGYSGMSKYLQQKLHLTRGENFFEFPYDWRRDNRISAMKLRTAAMELLDVRRSRFPDAKLVLVAHSMGGLVSRYFLEALEGWKDTRTLITLGTPHRGSVKALDFLVNGWRKKVGPITLVDLSKLVRSLPSMYQLLPIYRCVGGSADKLQNLETIGEVGDLDMDRAREGVAFHREIEARVRQNQADTSYRESGYRIVPVVGAYQPTYLSAVLDKEGVSPLRTYEGDPMKGGDGTVPRFSATPIELSDAGRDVFAACPHGGLQNHRSIRTQIRAVLEDEDISELKSGREEEAIELSLNDAFHVSEDFRAWISAPSAVGAVNVAIENLDTGEVNNCDVSADPERTERQMVCHDSLAPGSYRLTVDAGDATDPISDVFAVIG